MTVLPLAACGGGGDGAPTSTNSAPISSTAGSFTEVNTGVFVANNNSNSSINQSNSSSDLTVVGRNGNDRITTGNGFDLIDGGEGNDNIASSAGDDTVWGAAGRDTINSGAGADYVEGGAGADNLDGGIGNDILAYTLSGSGVIINLGAGTASGGDASGDVFSNFEGVFGSEYADTITGDQNNNLFDGFGGIDILSGGGGNDIFLAFESDEAHLDEINGDEGYDGIIFFSESDKDAYWVSLSELNASNIEFINLLDSTGMETIAFSAQDVIDVTDGSNTLVIIGDEKDSFQSNDLWVYEGDTVDGDLSYSTYTSGGATIHVYDTMLPTNMFLPVSGSFYESSSNVWQTADHVGASIDLSASVNDLTIIGSINEDTIITGSGDDTIHYSSGDVVDAGGGTDTIITDDNIDLNSNANILNVENLTGGSGNQSLTGDDEVNVIIGGDGYDIIVGGGNADILDGGDGTDTLSYFNSTSGVTVNLFDNSASNGDAAGDVISNFERLSGSPHADHLTGTNANNNIYGYSGNDTIFGLNGNDNLDGGGGNDIIHGGEGNDQLEGRDGNDTIYGNTGADTITGGDGSDIIYGGEGNDRIYGHDGSDQIYAGDGDDYVLGGSGGDILDGGDGIDTLDYSDINADLNINLTTNTASGGNASGDTIQNFENIIAYVGDDILTGNDVANEIQGGNGNDIISTAGDDDILWGGSGSDTLDGGAGADTIYGESGNDIIYYDVNDTVNAGDAWSDTLLVNNSGENIDMSLLNHNNFEVLDLNTTGANTLTLTAQDVLDFTLSNSSNDTLRVDGNSQDTVNSLGEGWIKGADQVIDSESYHTYTAGGATLLVDMDIIQDIS